MCGVPVGTLLWSGFIRGLQTLGYFCGVASPLCLPAGRPLAGVALPLWTVGCICLRGAERVWSIGEGLAWCFPVGCVVGAGDEWLCHSVLRCACPCRGRDAVPWLAFADDARLFSLAGMQRERAIALCRFSLTIARQLLVKRPVLCWFMGSPANEFDVKGRGLRCATPALSACFLSGD